MFAQLRHEGAEFARQPMVVRVEKRDVFAARRLDSRVTRDGRAAIDLIDLPYLRGEGAEDVSRIN
jgi:hypothetical protein